MVICHHQSLSRSITENWLPAIQNSCLKCDQPWRKPPVYTFIHYANPDKITMHLYILYDCVMNVKCCCLWLYVFLIVLLHPDFLIVCSSISLIICVDNYHLAEVYQSIQVSSFNFSSIILVTDAVGAIVSLIVWRPQCCWVFWHGHDISGFRRKLMLTSLQRSSMVPSWARELELLLIFFISNPPMLECNIIVVSVMSTRVIGITGSFLIVKKAMANFCDYL